MSDESERRGRGRRHNHGEAPLPAADRDMAKVAYTLKDALNFQATRSAFIARYRGTPSGQQLRRGLARLLGDDPDNLMAFFDGLISSGDD